MFNRSRKDDSTGQYGADRAHGFVVGEQGLADYVSELRMERRDLVATHGEDSLAVARLDRCLKETLGWQARIEARLNGHASRWESRRRVR